MSAKSNAKIKFTRHVFYKKNALRTECQNSKKMAAKIFEFDALIRSNDKVNAGFIEFPYDVVKEFGGKGRVKVKALIDGCPYRGSLAKMGGDCHLL